MALHGLYCADVPLRNCSLIHSLSEWNRSSVQQNACSIAACRYRHLRLREWCMKGFKATHLCM